MLAGKDLIVMPGGFSPVYARMAQEIGFRCFFLAGSQLSGFLLGVPDAGILGLRDIVDHARHVAAHTSIPLLLDADTGFGNAVNVQGSAEEIPDRRRPALHPVGRGGRQNQRRGSGARRDRPVLRYLRPLRFNRRRARF